MKRSARILSFDQAKMQTKTSAFHAGNGAYLGGLQQNSIAGSSQNHQGRTSRFSPYSFNNNQNYTKQQNTTDNNFDTAHTPKPQGKRYTKPRSSLMMYLSQDDFRAPKPLDEPSWLNALGNVHSNLSTDSGTSHAPKAHQQRKNAKVFNLQDAENLNNSNTAQVRVNKQQTKRNVKQGESASAQEDGSVEPKNITRAQRRAAHKKAKAKQKAARAFNEQFGAGENQDKPASRAAVYTGKLGTQQKRAQRMQNGKKNSSAVLTPVAVIVSIFQNFKPNKRILFPCLSIVACLLIAVCTLYQPAKNYYTSVRDLTKLQQEYDAIQSRNDSLQQDVNSLQTVAGVQARAHEQLGWVEEGENSANVRGLNLEEEEAASNVVANVAPSDFQATQTWYSPFLDAFFGYK